VKRIYCRTFLDFCGCVVNLQAKRNYSELYGNIIDFEVNDFEVDNSLVNLFDFIYYDNSVLIHPFCTTEPKFLLVMFPENTEKHEAAIFQPLTKNIGLYIYEIFEPQFFSQ